MTDTSAATPTLTIAILSSQCLVWLGGFEEQERMRAAFAYGVDGVILTV